MKRTNAIASRRTVISAAVGFALFLGGCSALSTPVVPVLATPPPSATSSPPLPALADDDSRLALILSESARVMDTNALKFFAAREAFWDYDTDTAVRLFREVRAAEAMSAEHFHDVVLQCYEQSDRWADTLPLYREFGIEESHAARLTFARFMAGLPPRSIEFAPTAHSTPFELKQGSWVVAEASINGVKAKVGLDTGAGLTWISERFARRIGMRLFEQTISLSDANGSARDAPIGLISELRLGGLTARNMRVVAGRSFLMSLFGSVDAIVGWDILQHADVTWDFPRKAMVLAAPGGPVTQQPNLSGRIGPVVTVLSSAGRPMELFLDTGAHGNRRTAMNVRENGGVLATKLALADFRPSWLPTIGAGLHSVWMSWPRRARPFTFWMGGYTFDLPSAALDPGELMQENLLRIDGVMGNTPFLGGKLRICGVRRELTFEPATRTGASELIRASRGLASTHDVDPSRRRRPVQPLREPETLLDLASTHLDGAYLSDASWIGAEVGWGKPARDQFWVFDGHAVPLVLSGQHFAKGLYAHSASRYRFALAGKWKSFTATIGIRDGAHEQGSAIFTVVADGRELYRSPLLRVGSKRDIALDVTGVNELELHVDGGEGHPHNSWAIWAEPLLVR